MADPDSAELNVGLEKENLQKDTTGKKDEIDCRTTIEKKDGDVSKTNSDKLDNMPLQSTSDKSNQNSEPSSHSSSQNSAQVGVEQQMQKLQRDLESMVLRYATSERENLKNKNKVEELDKKLKRTIKDNDQLANRVKLLTNDKNQLTDTLNAKVAQLTVLEQKNHYLNNVQGVKLREYEEKIKLLESTNEDFVNQIESFKSKEGELLDFSERLSMKHMLLQTELDEALKKVPNYKDLYESSLKEKDDLMKNIDELTEEIESLKLKVKSEQDYCLALKAENEENDLKYRRSLDELHNEIKVMRRKHQIANRELVRELKQLQAQVVKEEPSIVCSRGS